MKFSAQEEYGLRCILQLARQELAAAEKSTGPAALTVSEIAQSEGLTSEYAGKLIRILGRAGLVESARGCMGGYRLARPPEQINVAETLKALGGTFFNPEMCGRFTGDRESCVHSMDCSIRSLWSGIHGMIDGVLSRTSLKDLAVPEKSLQLSFELLVAGGDNFQTVLKTLPPGNPGPMHPGNPGNPGPIHPGNPGAQHSCSCSSNTSATTVK